MMPGASRRIRWASAALISFSNSMLIASEWPTKTGTRTQVAVTLIFGSRIFLVSTTIFHSSLVEPSSRNSSIWGMTLKAICLVKTVASLESPTKMFRLCSNSSSMPFFPAPAPAHEALPALPEHLVHALLPRARDRLVGRDDDALDPGGIVERLQGDHHLGGRAIGIGDDVLAAIAVDGVGVHLRHDQRHVRVHPVERAVVDDGAARGGARRGILPRHRRARRRRG